MPTMPTKNSPPEALHDLRGFAGLPCLIFPASRTLTSAEASVLLEGLQTFLGDWASHGAPVTGAGAVIENRFVAVAHRPADISGCGRDSLMFFLKDAGARMGLEWQGGSRVFYRDAGGTVADTDRPGFRKLAAVGVVSPDTVVFDTTVRETDVLLAGGFALPARDSWHARLLPGS